ncbi:MAG: hypothetical protein C5B57_09460 [Blastocatellia bacterium]|nr:MAG: hypothetical protein C5B57_09460 [Blastocatellia bacterium]
MNATKPAFRDEVAATSSADDWFAALDQRYIGTGDRRWVAQVLGVHGAADGLWVQLAPNDDPSATIVLHLSTKTRIEDVLVALETRTQFDGRPHIIDLASN